MKKIVTILVLAIVIGAVALMMTSADEYHTRERVKWKDQALSELRDVKISSDNPDFTFTYDDWFSPQGILMRDRSWIAFRSKDRKENSKISDIFIGRASNGKWYYSTYHFCIGAITIMDEQPDTLKAFIEQCDLIEFDGQSDQCLLPTWPPK